MNETATELTEMMTAFMVRNRLTQAEMARLVGVSTGTMSDWLSGKRTQIRRSHVLTIRSVCDPARSKSASTATATATPDTATATATACHTPPSSAPATPLPPEVSPAYMSAYLGGLEAYRKRVLGAIMTADDVPIEARLAISAIVSVLPTEG